MYCFINAGFIAKSIINLVAYYLYIAPSTTYVPSSELKFWAIFFELLDELTTFFLQSIMLDIPNRWYCP